VPIATPKYLSVASSSEIRVGVKGGYWTLSKKVEQTGNENLSNTNLEQVLRSENNNSNEVNINNGYTRW